MLRRYTVERLLEKVDMLRSRVPDIAISTDIIAGFPGETAAEFEDTLALMRTVRFDEAYTYKYSARDGTPATRLPAEDFLPAEVAQARLERLIDVSRGIVAEIARSELGRVEEVLVERAARTDGQVLGRTRRNKVVAFPGDPSMIGRYYGVVLEDTTGVTFVGRLVEEPALTGTR
jgi:tRNA-2-methylthio-N6-dimethylallyladenosine synthase